MNNKMSPIEYFSMVLNTMQDMEVNREKYKVGWDDAGGLTVSTCYTPDCGYETAILDSQGAHPVQRYANKEEAVEGHKQWCVKAPSLTTIMKLGDGFGIIEDQEFILRRAEKMIELKTKLPIKAN